MLKGNELGATERGDLFRSLGTYVAQLHALGFFHAHLNPQHFFLSDDGQFTLIDLDRSCFSPLLWKRAKAENLYQLRKSLRNCATTEEIELLRHTYREACID